MPGPSDWSWVAPAQSSPRMQAEPYRETTPFQSSLFYQLGYGGTPTSFGMSRYGAAKADAPTNWMPAVATRNEAINRIMGELGKDQSASAIAPSLGQSLQQQLAGSRGTGRERAAAGVGISNLLGRLEHSAQMQEAERRKSLIDLLFGQYLTGPELYAHQREAKAGRKLAQKQSEGDFAENFFKGLGGTILGGAGAFGAAMGS